MGQLHVHGVVYVNEQRSCKLMIIRQLSVIGYNSWLVNRMYNLCVTCIAVLCMRAYLCVRTSVCHCVSICVLIYVVRVKISND